jgi:hypothetical protein
MARKTFYLDRAQPHPLYKTRMLQAGPLELDAGAAALYRKLGVEMLDEAPKKKVIPTVEQVLTAEVVEEPAKPAPKKAAKRKAKK